MLKPSHGLHKGVSTNNVVTEWTADWRWLAPGTFSLVLVVLAFAMRASSILLVSVLFVPICYVVYNYYILGPKT